MKKIETILQGDALEQLRKLPAESAHVCVTSPPYYNLRDYGMDGQIGMEETPEKYVERLVAVFREVRRVLRQDGTLWLNMGDSYAGSGKGRMADGTFGGKRPSKSGNYAGTSGGHLWKTTTGGCKPKDLLGIPWTLAFALRSDGWYLRQDVIWSKPNCMPESIKDRCTKSHEYLFLLSKSPKYYFDSEAIKEPCSESNVRDYLRRKELAHKGADRPDGYHTIRPDLYRTRDAFMPKDFRRNKRDVWIVPTKPFMGAHFAVFPEALITPCILAGSPVGGTVLDPFTGSGTAGVAAKRLQRSFVGIELNPAYRQMALERIAAVEPQKPANP